MHWSGETTFAGGYRRTSNGQPLRHEGLLIGHCCRPHFADPSDQGCQSERLVPSMALDNCPLWGNQVECVFRFSTISFVPFLDFPSCLCQIQFRIEFRTQSAGTGHSIHSIPPRSNSRIRPAESSSSRTHAVALAMSLAPFLPSQFRQSCHCSGTGTKSALRRPTPDQPVMIAIRRRAPAATSVRPPIFRMRTTRPSGSLELRLGKTVG